MNQFHAKTIEESFIQLQSSPQGLSQEEALRRNKQYGINELPEKRKILPIFLYLKQFNSLLIYILLIAAVISFAVNHVLDAAVIIAVVIVNSIVGFIQEYKAEKTVAALKKMIVKFAKVYRDGKLIKIPTSLITIGDIVLLEEGDAVPADGRLIEIKNFRTNEALLTGESFPVDKNSDPILINITLTDQNNMVWLGTTVATGAGKMAVTAIGAFSAIGQIATELETVKRPKTFFEQKTDQLAVEMGVIAIISFSIIFITGYFLRRIELFELFLFSIATLVSAIPEGLPAVLAIVLAVGALRMADQNAIIRHLPAVETLGVATVIVSDKTGTITENAMMAEKIALGDEGIFTVTGNGWESKGTFFKEQTMIHPLEYLPLRKLLHISTLTNNARIIRADKTFQVIGDPTDAALLVLGEKSGLNRDMLIQEEKILDEYPFDQLKRLKAVLVNLENEKQIYATGAFEKILERSSYYLLSDGSRKHLTSEHKERLLKIADNLSKSALRVIGIAFKSSAQEIIDPGDIEHLIFVGFVGMMDPPRPEVKQAIEDAKQAGIRVIMNTGDHKNTAIAIAQQIGLINIDEEAVALTEEDIKDMDAEDFSRAVKKISIFARIPPLLKLKIVEELQRQGEIVAVTGDGVNDALALKKAHVGISMGIIGTDVAREASDIVLTDDNFASIIKAVFEGRTAITNIKQTSFYLVTTNIAEVCVLLFGLFLGLPLMLLPIHILWLNLVTDGLSDVSLSAEPGHNAFSTKPQELNKRILSKEILPFLFLIVVLMVSGSMYMFYRYLPEGLEKSRTMTFITMAFFQLFNAFNMRSLKYSVFSIGIFSNKYLILAIIVSVVLQFTAVQTSVIQPIFKFVALSMNEWMSVILLTSSVLWFGEVYKYIKKSVEKRL